MTSIVYKYEGKEPEFDEREALRYAGMRGEDEGVAALLSECLAAARECVVYRAAWRELSADDPFVRSLISASGSAGELLFGASSVIILAASAGAALDRGIARLSVTSPARALLLNAIGTERVESLCDAVVEDIKKTLAADVTLTRRFSPGYGDMPLSFVADILSLLDAGRTLGITLNESKIMSPSKSVTAVIGVFPAPL